MCAIVVKKGDETLAEEVVEFCYEDRVLRLKGLFAEEILLEGVKEFVWSERDDTLRILG